MFARQGDPAQTAAERESGPDQVGVAERAPVLVLDDLRRAAVAITGVDERGEQRAPTLGRNEVQRRSLFHQAPSNLRREVGMREAQFADRSRAFSRELQVGSTVCFREGPLGCALPMAFGPVNVPV